MNILRTILTTAVVGSVSAAVFLVFLGHRTDYVGHYSAGFGGTLVALAIGVGLIARETNLSQLSRVVLILLVAAIMLGGVFESTIFRLAIFDPVDFCNQSLGAAIAALAVLGAAPKTPMFGGEVGLMFAVGTFFVLVGFHYAFM
ncbi:MAG: hypothetical protein R3E01_35190 [Pirellulaceae bacterium]|nr:hypothetical protein [Planctomycetales bacterium]